MAKIKIRFKMTVVGNNKVKDYYVDEDKRPGGFDRMCRQAINQAMADPFFPDRVTLYIKSNWIKYVR
jgi:hypothetical protein